MLPRLIGLPNALDLLLSARVVGAEEALRLGLVNRVFPAESFMSQVRDYAREIAGQVSPRSVAAIKGQVYGALFQSLEQATIGSNPRGWLHVMPRNVFPVIAASLRTARIRRAAGPCQREFQ